MKDEEIKKKIFTRLYNSVPKAIWAIAASMSIMILSLSLSLNFAHVRAGDALNDYMQILLKREDNKSINQEWRKEIESRMIKLEEENKFLKSQSHKAN